MADLSVWLGPMLRRVTCDRLTFLIATSQPVELRLTLYCEGDQALITPDVMRQHLNTLTLARKLHLYLIEIPLAKPLQPGS